MEDASLLFLGCIVLLMLVNWYLEAFKWQQICTLFKIMNIKDAARDVLAGLSFGIVTPARVGEYGGRALFMSSDEVPKSIQANFIASLSQNIINLLFGLVGGTWYMYAYVSWGKVVSLGLLGFGVLLLSILWFILQNQDKLIPMVINRWPKTEKYLVNISLDKPMQGIIAKALLLSTLRYVVFVSQYVMFLYFYGISEQLVVLVSGISLIYLIQSGIPLPAFLSIVSRGELALLIWSVFELNGLSIIAATFSLWILNLVLPAIVGALIVLVKK